VEKFYPGLPIFPNIDEPDWFYHQIKPLESFGPLLNSSDARTIILNTEYHKMPDNTTRYMVNKRIAPHYNRPAYLRYQSLDNTLRKTSLGEYNSLLDTYPIQYNEVIDLVFQNKKSDFGCLLHPWHTHGHSHYVIASGSGDYIHERDQGVRNFVNPLFRDTTVAYPSVEVGENGGCGWTKVRFLANNPGFWAVHCHITTHMLQGKMIVLEEAPELIHEHRRYQLVG
ncbi:hypothetical protein CU098_001517, partial [Rhizopus stolonifer]